MASTALHEAVHAVLDLSGRQPLNLTTAEEIAYGAEACFLLALEGRDALTTMQALRLRAHLRDSIYADETDDFPRRCEIYQDYFAAIWR
jgi:enamine deaminase RidA (YjgF/YER057c/UK114 family)